MSSQVASLALAMSFLVMVDSFVPTILSNRPSFVVSRGPLVLGVKPPQGSPYYQPEDEPNPLPSGYTPMLEYPGTMRPSKVRENSPFEDLPLKQTMEEALDENTVTLPSSEVENGGCGVNVPWPHFQDIPYHITWGSANESEMPIEEFIDSHGRWLSEEEEEELQKGGRGKREVKSEDTVVVDDEEDEEEEGSQFEEFDDVSSKLEDVEEVKDETADLDDDNDDGDDADDLDDDDEEEDDDDLDDEEDEALLDDLLGF
ncbi:hypothetical protein TrLO_g770 [Triparma laevis f. longispina]|uniref:Uncharacterized protein n=1 Tax=Triparma laevis f. longispina TaxID=1714387 RepID=A0A9W7C8A7_9STRA|nr:hypothetical protein TrLO_g770 [Triparma laevis f. longispina]